MKTVSVVVPVYNQAAYLGAAIESVLQQSYCPHQIIVIDDGSTDDSLNVARQYSGYVSIIAQPNRGLAGARNAGILRASGDYVAFLDSDDIWLPDFLDTMLRAAGSGQFAVCFSIAQCIDAMGEDLPQRAGARPTNGKNLYDTLLYANFLIPSTVIVSRHALHDVGLFDDSNPDYYGCEDWDLWLRLAAKGHRFHGVEKCLVKYRVHRDSMSTNVSRMQHAVVAVMVKHFGSDDGQYDKWDGIKRRAFGGAYRYAALSSVLRLGDWEGAVNYLVKALTVFPDMAYDVDLFFELSLGQQPMGFRGTDLKLDLYANSVNLAGLLEVLQRDAPLVAASVSGTAYYALSMVAYSFGYDCICRFSLIKASHFRPDLLRSWIFVGLLLRSLMPYALRKRLRAWVEAVLKPKVHPKTKVHAKQSEPS